jgi:DNA polymerase III delta subunit
MVIKETWVYFFIGEDGLAKDKALQRLKAQILAKESQEFNFDSLYGKEATKPTLQEKLLTLPFKSPKRMLVIKSAQDLKEEAKKYLEDFIRKPSPRTVLVFDAESSNPKDGFFDFLSKNSRVFRCRQEERFDTFALGRQIELKKTQTSLRMLNKLLQDGEKPERILGGLRHAWERDLTNPAEKKKRLKLLLNCDLDIKTGRLKPVFVLERLIVSLCGFQNSLCKP